MENPSDAPTFAVQTLAALARSGLNVVAGVLVSSGVLTGDQSTQFVTIGVALILWVGNYGWSLRQKRDAQRRLVNAIAAPAGFAVTPATTSPSGVAGFQQGSFGSRR